MTVLRSLRRALGWLMLSLALGGVLVPPALADRDSSHYGEADAASFHAHLSGLEHSHDDPLGDAHGEDYCAEHCCSDLCTPALNSAASPAPGKFSVPLWQAGLPTPPNPADEPFIPPRIA